MSVHKMVFRWTKRKCVKSKENGKMENKKFKSNKYQQQHSCHYHFGLYSVSICVFEWMLNNRFQWRFFRIEILSIKNDVRNVISFSFLLFCHSLPINRLYISCIDLNHSQNIYHFLFFFLFLLHYYECVCAVMCVWMCIRSFCPHRSP